MKTDCCTKDSGEIIDLGNFLKTISEANRLRIICLLREHSELCVCEIQAFLQLSQNLVSHHLKVLSAVGLLESRKDGLNVYYSIQQKEMKKKQNLFNKFIVISDK